MQLQIREWHSGVYKVRDSNDIYYNSDEWKQLRDECIKRDHGYCMVEGCKIHGRKNVNAHHIMPRRSGGPDILSNLITLCNRHHDIVEDDPEKYCTYQIIAGMEIASPRIPRRPKIIHQCPACPGIVCWHMIVYGGVSRNFFGMKILDDGTISE